MEVKWWSLGVGGHGDTQKKAAQNVVDSPKTDQSCAFTTYILLVTDDLQTGVLFRYIKCLFTDPTSKCNST